MTESGGHTRSEAVYLDAVSDDGEWAMVARLCRYPQRGVQWAWLHVFAGAQVYSFTDHGIACGAAFTDLDAADALYEASSGDLRIRFERRGAVAAPSAATLFAQVRAHAQDSASFVVPADGPGSVAVSVKASFVPDAVPVSNRQGRHEMQGKVLAELIVADQPHQLEARGHFHEQEQTDPRFTVPFTYASLRGEDFGLIFIRGARGVRGQFTEGGRSVGLTRVDMSGPGSRRDIDLSLADGRRLHGTLQARHRYEVRVQGESRPASIVAGSIGGRACSGCVNDFRVDALPFLPS
jgi:hypothetical protein